LCNRALEVQAALPYANSDRPSESYRRRRPEDTVLYRCIEAHWPEFRERAEEVGGLPKFVVREFEQYLRCGRLEHGCLHLVCRACGHSQLVAFSRKKRGFCPSCCGRRMVDMAVHLEQRVLPAVPIRPWICSLPWGLRALCGYDRELCAEVVSAFVGEVSRSLKRRAKRLLGLASVADAHTGAVASIQRTDSALRLNVHTHVLALDGVYVRQDEAGPLVFHPRPTPTGAEVADVARRTAKRILVAHGRSLDPVHDDQEHPLCLEQPGLAACYAAAAQGVSVTGDRAGQPTLRLVLSPHEPRDHHAEDEPVAEVGGVNMHAKQRVDGHDRRQVERLCKYITRPPVAQDRLSLRADGRLELRLKSVWKDGTRALVFEPHDLLVRLVAAAPPPNFHLLRYFGVLSSHSALRAEVVPEPIDDPAQAQPPPLPGEKLCLLWDDDDNRDPPPRHRYSWLLQHVFAADLDHCPRCGGPMRWLEIATTPDAIARLMAKHGLAPRPPPPPPHPRRPVSLAQLSLPFAT
jgi:hypothetical protein